MDSLTQAVLGAVVVEAVAGRQIGNRALLWGLWFGTLPDLDILLYPWLDPLERLGWHRGLSHSLFLMTVTAPLWGWLVARVHRGRLGWARASGAVWLALFTHVLIDVFTVYGTQVFEPFSDFRLATNNLFIIDPLFTLPMLVALGVIPWLRADDVRRRRWNAWGLALATAYVGWSFAAKGVAHQRVAAALEAEGIPHTRFMTAPAPFNTILWRALVETEDGLLVGYTSLLDRPGTPFRWERVPRREWALGPAEGSRAVEILRWFSQGYWTASPHAEGPLLFDWRFGEIRGGGGAEMGLAFRPLFAWQLREEAPGRWTFVQVRAGESRWDQSLALIWRRLWGEPVM